MRGRQRCETDTERVVQQNEAKHCEASKRNQSKVSQVWDMQCYSRGPGFGTSGRWSSPPLPCHTRPEPPVQTAQAVLHSFSSGAPVWEAEEEGTTRRCPPWVGVGDRGQRLPYSLTVLRNVQEPHDERAVFDVSLPTNSPIRLRLSLRLPKHYPFWDSRTSQWN